MECKYPEIEVELVGENGNAFVIMGRVSEALRRCLWKYDKTPAEIKSEIELYQKESMSGDYDNLLITAMNWVEVS